MNLPAEMPRASADREKLIATLATALVRTLGATAALALAAALDDLVAEQEQKR